MDLGAEIGRKTVRFLITTQLIGEFVLLQIDDVEPVEASVKKPTEKQNGLTRIPKSVP